MIRMRSRRALLRRYANDGLKALEKAYSVQSQFFFQGILRNFWNRRARLFFDAQNKRMPYIDHIYTMDYPHPHTHGDTNMFVNLTVHYPEERDPPASPLEIRRILNIYRVRDRSDQNVLDVLAELEENAMSSTEYYYEIHSCQFYRVLFFVLEMQIRGIVTDENDTHDGPVFDLKVPKSIQALVYDDNVYRKYLLMRRSHELNSSDTENVYRQNLRQSDRVREEDLIMLMWTRIRNRIKTTISTSTTPQYRGSKKGSGRVNEHGKYFLKNRKSLDDSKCENNCTIQTKVENNDQYYGYINHPNQLPLTPADETSTFSRILRGVLSFFSGGSVLDEGLRRR